MIELDIPGRGSLRIERVVCDFNGTLATDGLLEPGVAEALLALRQRLPITILTADTHGRAAEQLAPLDLEPNLLDAGDEAEQKRSFVQRVGAQTTAFLGNGANDEAAMELAALSLAVVGREGAFVRTLEAADLVLFRPLDALELLLHPQRLLAGLRH